MSRQLPVLGVRTWEDVVRDSFAEIGERLDSLDALFTPDGKASRLWSEHAKRLDALETAARPAASDAAGDDEHTCTCSHWRSSHRDDVECVVRFCRCEKFVPAAPAGAVDPVLLAKRFAPSNADEVILSLESWCGIRAWDDAGGRMIEIFGDGQPPHTIYIKNDSKKEVAELILGKVPS